ncbi:gamma-type small acid-soluble spore protein [Bacillus sp. 165]|uniref:gamma-type small acid-soluble spore protein n=1 Tax=Bacillus sp. 165 TaxID=1529117 RepID=UPI001AD9B4E2|nr:gamma-type small acid-soluble spore protein [Bacillus sp. 165]
MGVRIMNNQSQKGYPKTTSGASIQKVTQSNAAYGQEFSTETDVQEVKQANAQAEAKKSQASANYSNPQQ